MLVLVLVLMGTLALVQALPQALPQAQNTSLTVAAKATTSSVPLPSSKVDFYNKTNPIGRGNGAITDPVRLAYYDKIHKEVLESMRNGSAIQLRRL